MELKPFKTSLRMPNFVPTDPKKLQKDAVGYDTEAYRLSDLDYKNRHPLMLSAEKMFESQTAKDMEGENELSPAMQNEMMRSGLTGALSSFGNTPGVLKAGGAAEAGVARNLGLSIAGFQDRNRQNRMSALSLAENLFPRREFGLSGADAAMIGASNNLSQNNWNQANYADNMQRKQFNYRIQMENLRGKQMGANAEAQAGAAEDAANTQAATAGATALAGLALLAFVCWVARAAYGEKSSAWHVFRMWLLLDAPAWLRNFYLRHGQRIAPVVAGSRFLRFVTRSVMNLAVNAKRKEWACAVA